MMKAGHSLGNLLLLVLRRSVKAEKIGKRKNHLPKTNKRLVFWFVTVFEYSPAFALLLFLHPYLEY